MRDRRKWAPWWAYVVPILAINYLRQVVVPYGTFPEVVDALLAVLIAALLFVAITAGYRVARRSSRGTAR